MLSAVVFMASVVVSLTCTFGILLNIASNELVVVNVFHIHHSRLFSTSVRPDEACGIKNATKALLIYCSWATKMYLPFKPS